MLKVQSSDFIFPPPLSSYLQAVDMLSHGPPTPLPDLSPSLLPPPPSVEDLLSHLGHRMEPFLPALIAITLRLLASATSGITGGGELLPPPPLVDGSGGGAVVVALPGPPPTAEAIDRSREIRSSSLKLLAQVRVFVRGGGEVQRGCFNQAAVTALRPYLHCILPLMTLMSPNKGERQR